MTGVVLAPAGPDDLLTPEDLTEDHRAIARTVDEFWRQDVAPRLEALRRHDTGVARMLLEKAAALGLTAMQTPEAYGGLGLDLSSVAVAVEHLAADASYLGWHLGHSGIGTLPLVYYGTDAQKRRYLPRLASAELVAAYALTEPEAGSDALAIRTRADLADDGRHYILDGRKMWITNGGEADLFTVFAKVDGTAFTAFLVERSFGVRSGPEERKMGLEGTSTTALYLDRVHVPIDNVLGQIGQGHQIAFNVLNAGRLKLGPNMVGAAKAILAACVAYARDRHAFGRPIASFGAIQQKLAASAARLYAAESATWRAVGLIERETEAGRAHGLESAGAELSAFRTHAAECAIVKVLASEMLDAVADEGVQIHGGHGYHRDTLVERAYRDARINRIFEGTNEINRLVITSQLLKRSLRGQTTVVAQAADTIARAADLAATPAADAAAMTERARTLTLLMIGAARERIGDRLTEDQEIAMHVADGLIETFAMEAAVWRARKLAACRGAGAATAAHDLARAVARESLRRMARATEIVMTATAADTATATARLGAVRALAACAPFDEIALGRAIAAHVLDAGGYRI